MDNSEIKLTAPRRYADYELLTEIFGFVPTVVLDDLFNLTNVLFYKFMEGTADKIIAARPDKLREINMALDNYERMTESKLDKLFNILQQYTTQKAWDIPKDLDIQLDQHKDLNFALTEEEDQEIDDRLQEMREKIIAQKKFQAILNKTYQDIEHQNIDIDKQIKELTLIHDIPKQENVNNVKETLTFVKNQVELLERSATRSLGKEDATINMKPTERTKYLRSKIAEDLDNFKI